MIAAASVSDLVMDKIEEALSVQKHGASWAFCPKIHPLTPRTCSSQKTAGRRGRDAANLSLSMQRREASQRAPTLLEAVRASPVTCVRPLLRQLAKPSHERIDNNPHSQRQVQRLHAVIVPAATPCGGTVQPPAMTNHLWFEKSSLKNFMRIMCLVKTVHRPGPTADRWPLAADR